MKSFEKTVVTTKSFDDAVAAIERKTADNGFRVLHVHDIGGMLTEKGFPRPPLKVIEICGAKYASEVLNKDVKISLMLPCPISVYVANDKTYVTTLLPSSMTDFYPKAGIEKLADEVEAILMKIIREAVQ